MDPGCRKGRIVRTFAQKEHRSHRQAPFSPTRSSTATSAARHSVDSILHPQQNRAVPRLQRANAEDSGMAPGAAAPTRFGHDFGRIPVYPEMLDTPGDTYEQEADRTADRVMRMPDAPEGMPPGQVQRLVRTEGSQANEATHAGAPPLVHDVLRSPAQLLDPVTRTSMERRFGHDFGEVRIHTDARAVESAQGLRARAYTVGNDIVFAAGQYRPESAAGRRLLAHELAHVVQQKASAGRAGPAIRRQAQNPLAGRSTFETVDYRVEALLDAALIQSSLWPYIGHKVTRGTRIEGGVTYLSQRAFEEAYIAHARRRGEAVEKAKEVRGFYDPGRGRIVAAVPANLETLLHEGIHKFADPSFRQIFTPGFDEGVTQYFTNRVLQEYGLEPGRAYPEEVMAGNALAATVGFEELALGYFLGPALNVLRALESKVPDFDTNAFMHAIREKTVDWGKIARMIRVTRLHYEVRQVFR